MTSATITGEKKTPSAPEEVITSAHLRLLDVPGIAGKVALITLDNGLDHQRPSTFGPGGIAGLNAALDAAFAAEPAAIAVTGKPFVFAVGADLSQIATITDHDSARATGVLGHSTFKRLTDSSIPTFAFVNGAAIGGGVELALSCDYRTMAANAPMMALSECFLGILPGWGGTQLLPKIVGPENAITVIIENALNQNHMMRPAEALGLGVVDVVLDAADYLEQSLVWMADVLAGRITVSRTNYAGAEFDDQWTSALERGRLIADMRTHGASPAPYRALELIALSRTADLATGLAAEADGLADLIVSQQFRAGLYSFNLTQKRARKPAGAPDLSLARKVTKVGVIGAGLMAGQIALLFAQRLHVPVVLTDVDQTRLDKGLAGVHRKIAERAAQRKMTQDEANRLTALVTGSLDYQAFSDADFVIEAVFEELGAKQTVFAALEKVVSPEAVLATNTSSLSITDMSAGLAHPERVIGFHFFNPISVMPLLEIVRTAATSDSTAATALSVAKTLRKGPIFTADAPAFVVNRLLTRFMGEIIAAIDEGTDPAVADAALAPLGLPMTPIMLLQLVGPAVALHVTETLHQSFPDRFEVSENLRRIVAAGHRTLVSWTETGQQVLDPEVAALWEQGTAPSTGEQVRDRALAALAQEARLMLDEKVVAAAADIDLALITGAGWPFWLGGITPYLDREGVSEKVTGRRFNPPGVSTMP
ncbi:3-hydroxyacyl-CoA dehydrogenase NAD-binding domain-containing protein [Nakamurella sp. PAMC28650]|uniref:3-hydroxyacyl-CoA dehydrogenase NAD-binding domain-containing protein n=1 Tax=Nakamurella sp. PAMC28650 TaxID=2762325 RepID=UPI00164E078E|nr:3-hydroxyacyl-CoA dehydrogenase NAD-binding domain-containing protein [Nakamurella sp. PAMC28650]QNK79288.1 enoyl-CoA hydratase/isomerase family protein [Nakamurella sp. PAMC28650]